MSTKGILAYYAKKKEQETNKKPRAYVQKIAANPAKKKSERQIEHYFDK